MDRKLWAEEQRLRHARDRSAALALLLWAVGGYLLYLSWRAAEAFPPPWSAIALTGIYLVTFFYVFAFWPILIAVEKMFRGLTPIPSGPLRQNRDHVIHYRGPPPESGGAQDGGNAIHAERSSIGSSREVAGGVSSSDAGR
jgi:hypothetical protein